jgi:hypothetical protein
MHTSTVFNKFIHSRLLVGSCCSIFSFLCRVLYAIACSLFYLAILLSVLLRFTAFEYSFGIFKLLLVFAKYPCTRNLCGSRMLCLEKMEILWNDYLSFRLGVSNFILASLCIRSCSFFNHMDQGNAFTFRAI